MKQKPLILICESDTNFSNVLKDFLENDGMHVLTAKNTDEAWTFLQNEMIDICLIEALVNEKSSIALLKKIRKSENNVPIFIFGSITYRDDIIQFYKQGADDFIQKPFSTHILVCKIRALLNRIHSNKDNQRRIFNLGECVFNSVNHTLGNYKLSAKEAGILLLLCQQKNDLVDRKEILEKLWQKGDKFTIKSLSVHISKLRQTLRELNLPYEIKNCSKKGYKLAEIQPFEDS